MVKVLAPALSLEASGSLGGALVFATWKGRPYVRTLVKPSNPKSPMQTGMRSMMKFLGHEWDSIKGGVTGSYTDIAENKNISEFNAYIQANLARWRSGFAPSILLAAEMEKVPTTVDTFTALAGPRNIAITYSSTASADQWGIILCRSTSPGFVPSWANAIAVLTLPDTDDHVFIDAPLEIGSYYYRAAMFTDDGALGEFKTEITETVT
jgi:hypothetical protein